MPMRTSPTFEHINIDRVQYFQYFRKKTIYPLQTTNSTNIASFPGHYRFLLLTVIFCLQMESLGMRLITESLVV